MKTSKLSKSSEWTENCVVKKYDSILKAYRIARRCSSRAHTQQVVVVFNDTVCFKYVPGRPLISDNNWLAIERYLNRYYANIDRVVDCQWAENFYCEHHRGEPVEVLKRIPTMLNRNWHGDMCQENIITDGVNFTDIDLREDVYGDVYYDFAKFYRSMMYNSLTDSFVPYSPLRDYFKDWVVKCGFDWDAVYFVTGIVFKRMGLLHNRRDLLHLGERICEA